MNVKATNKVTGELIDLPATSFEEIVMAYRFAKEYEKTADNLKNQLKILIPKLLDENGRSPISLDGYQFKQTESQRTNYNKFALKQVFDEDIIDLFLEVSKSKVDKYIKENKLTPDQLIELKKGLEPNGLIIKTTRLDKIS